jgi:photosystem II stability/assembly factor-like uncharacterized protein
MRLPRILCSTALAALLAMPAAPPAQAAVGGPGRTTPAWELGPTGTTSRLRGLAAVSRDVAWAAGSGGTVLRTLDGGRGWQNVSPPGTAELQFRDIEAFGADSAVALAIGESDASRVYRTDDGGRTWALTFRNDDPRAFYDCMAFFDRDRGLAVSDPVDGRFRILSTQDGGRSWRVLPSGGMPPALEGEFAFAASGQCLVTHGKDAWLATGGGARSRVFHSRDGGTTWSVTASPLPSGEAQGIFALAFRDARHGLAVGGDYRPGEPSPDAAATTRDGGHRWAVATRPPGSYRSGAAWLGGEAAIAVGPTGSDITFTGGRTWRRFDTGSFDTVDCAAHGACWASGEQGRVARLRP